MPRQRTRQPEKILGDMTHPDSFGTLHVGFLNWLKDRNYSAATIQHRRRYLNDFIDWAEQRSYTRPAELTRNILERYQRHLAQRMNRFGKPLSFRDQGQHLGALRAWYRWLVRQRYVIHNLALELELPRLSHPLPKYVPNRGEVEEILAQPDLMTTIGLRDRAILETFYSTGIRRCEIVRLTLWDIDRERGVIAVRMGKGRRDRMVPIGTRALAWLEKYRLEARPEFVVRETEAALYLTRMGEPFSPNAMTRLVTAYVRAAGITQGSCHLFRHAMATSMLEGGADTRFIQAVLGHVKLETTQIYTRVSVKKLKEVHDRTHGSRMPSEQKSDGSAGDSQCPE
jgi:integrase/recombinase XerD